MPPHTSSSKAELIQIRLDPEAKAVLIRAETLRGETLSGFLLSSALERANGIIDRNPVLRLNQREAERFLAALADPPKPADRLREAAARYEKAILEGDLETG